MLMYILITEHFSLYYDYAEKFYEICRFFYVDDFTNAYVQSMVL